jgi:transcriptional regulator with PAS, ATPase and Fis domain
VRKICRRTVGGGAPTVLITGETGTGKGLFAKALHYNSVRRNWALVELNCAAVPATLIEAELFGHERGAFTDARSARAGLFETADRGSLFLDEIAALDLSLQAKLLNVIEEKRVRRLGGSGERSVDVQIVAATAQDLEVMTAENRFRRDLFHRLDVVRIHLPPLRKRGDDRLLLAETFLVQLCHEYGLPARQLSAGARRAVERYDWPGNVRELRNRIERVVLLRDDAVVRTADLELPEPERRVEIRDGAEGLSVELPEQGFKLDDLEREVLSQSLERHKGNVSRAARFLGITRQTLIYRMRKHGL